MGWIKGFEDGTFRPDAYITRAQAMTMINRVLNRIPEENSDLPAGMNTWPDCNPGDWFSPGGPGGHQLPRVPVQDWKLWDLDRHEQNPDWTRYEH